MHGHAIAANTDDNLKSFPDPNISSELLQGAAEREHFIESLLWEKDGQYCLALVKNGAYQSGAAGFARMKVTGIEGEPAEIEVRITGLPVARIVNMRTGRSLGAGPTFRDTLKPWEANLYLLD